MTKVFESIAMAEDTVSDKDHVVYLLASLPASYSMLVTALEANAKVPKIIHASEMLLHEECKLKGREEASATHEKVMYDSR